MQTAIFRISTSFYTRKSMLQTWTRNMMMDFTIIYQHIKNIQRMFYFMSQLQSSFVTNIFYRHIYWWRLVKYKSVKLTDLYNTLHLYNTLYDHTNTAAIFKRDLRGMTCNTSFSLVNLTPEEEHHRFDCRTVSVLQLILLSLTIVTRMTKAGTRTQNNVNTQCQLWEQNHNFEQKKSKYMSKKHRDYHYY